MADEMDKHEIVEDVPVTQVITEEFIAKFEKQAELYQQRYLPICLKLTNEADWVSHAAGKFYLQSSGAEKICNPLAISWDSPMVVKHERKDDKGDFYEYEIAGIMTSKVLRRYIWTTGSCNSRDPFFNSRPGWTPSNGEGDIRKASFSNWIVNGVSRLAGIRNPTIEMLKKAGLNPDNIERIDYSGKNKSATAATDVISEPQVKRLMAIRSKAGLPEQKLADYLTKTFDYIKPDPEKKDLWHLAAQIRKKDYEAICTRIEQYKPTEPKPEPSEPGSIG